jgi:hypothetical protein
VLSIRGIRGDRNRVPRHLHGKTSIRIGKAAQEPPSSLSDAISYHGTTQPIGPGQFLAKIEKQAGGTH